MRSTVSTYGILHGDRDEMQGSNSVGALREEQDMHAASLANRARVGQTRMALASAGILDLGSGLPQLRVSDLLGRLERGWIV
jgi:hypothetical protein